MSKQDEWEGVEYVTIKRRRHDDDHESVEKIIKLTKTQVVAQTYGGGECRYYRDSGRIVGMSGCFGIGVATPGTKKQYDRYMAHRKSEEEARAAFKAEQEAIVNSPEFKLADKIVYSAGEQNVNWRELGLRQLQIAHELLSGKLPEHTLAKLEATIKHGKDDIEFAKWKEAQKPV
jgi:hypothetical protein